MAVDVKTLRIGSHILVNGKRERVRGLDEDNGLIIRFPAEYVNASEVEPIEITYSILKWLGFKREELNVVKCINEYLVYFHRTDAFSWRVGVANASCYFGGCIVRYLHEAEAFLALHGVELINENKND